MRNVGRHVVIDDLALRHVVEVGLGVVVFVELVDVDDVERAVLEADAGRHGHALDDRLDRPFAAGIGDRIDVAAGAEPRADEQRALVAPRHLARAGKTACPQLDLEAGRQLDAFQSGFDLFLGEAGRRRNGVRGMCTLLFRRLVAHEPVIRRMEPEVLAHGIVVLELLGAGAGRKQQSGDSDRCRGRDNHRRACLKLRYKNSLLISPPMGSVSSRHCRSASDR